jgi:hypothetical protein
MQRRHDARLLLPTLPVHVQGVYWGTEHIWDRHVQCILGIAILWGSSSILILYHGDHHHGLVHVSPEHLFQTRTLTGREMVRKVRLQSHAVCAGFD